MSEEKKIKRNRRETPDFKRIRELQKLHNISNYELAIAAGYSGNSPVSNMINAERAGYWRSGKSRKLCLTLDWDINEILPTTQNANSETPDTPLIENPVCDCISCAQSAMFLGQLSNQMLVLNHMIYKLCESLNIKLEIPVEDFIAEGRNVN